MIAWVLVWFSVSAHADDAFVLPELKVEAQADSSYLNALPSLQRLRGRKLEQKKQLSIGETLGREAGVNSSFFGPNASRPVIRGLDGDRIRVLENSLGTLDASSASPDHAVAVDPMILDEVDLIKGPAALLYGTNAVGGVVNLKTLRIASRPLEAPELKGTAQWSSVDRGRSISLMGRNAYGAPSRQWIIETDVVWRGSEDYSVPGFARTEAERTNDPLDPGKVEDFNRVSNSAQRGLQAGLGVTYLGSGERYGWSLSGLQSQYGVVAEKDVLIDLERIRSELEAEIRSSGFFENLRFKAALSHYQHQEKEGETVGTQFNTRGGEFRADLKHRKNQWSDTTTSEGVFGIQAQVFEFAAAGDEAFLPTSMNESLGLFAFEEWTWNLWKPKLGLRVDRSRVATRTSTRFTDFSVRDFWTPSASLGVSRELDQSNELQLQWTWTERAPNAQELFSRGDHAATGIYEQGDASLGTEKSWGVELSHRFQSDRKSIRGFDLKTSLFFQSYASFIALRPTGVTPSGAEYAQSNYQAVSAYLTGGEVQAAVPLEEDWLGGAWTLDAQLDVVYGRDRTHQASLPRMPPLRELLKLEYRRQDKGGGIPWTAHLEVQRSEAQSQVSSAEERGTPAFTLLNAGLELPFAGGQWRLNARAQNLLDQTARLHTSFLKEIAPLPGRNFVLSLQAQL